MLPFEASDALLNDALALLRDALHADELEVAEVVAEDPDGWGLFEPFEDGGETPDSRALAEHILGCVTSHIYDTVDDPDRGATPEPVRKLVYQAAHVWHTAALARLNGENDGA